MIVRTRWIAALAVVTTALVACGAHHQSDTRGTLALHRSSPRPAPLRLPRYPISLPTSSSGPTTCTVYESDFATQIVVDSPRLNVRAECELWSANEPGVGYLWGYERAEVTSDVLRLCTLTDPYREMTASVIEDTGFVPVSTAQRAKGGSACAAIAASGWMKARRSYGAVRPRPPAKNAISATSASTNSSG